MSALTKRDIVVAITDKIANTNVTQQLVGEVFDHLIDLISDQLSKGEKIVLRDFGVFEVVEQKARKGRNPLQPQDTVNVPARSVVKFRAGKELKNEVALALPYIREKMRNKSE